MTGAEPPEDEAAPALRVGIDLVQVSRVEESLARFGDHFLRRIFTEGEIAYASAAPALRGERLAARLAAKEAAIKALDLAEAGVGLRQIEVTKLASGAGRLRFHGRAEEIARDYLDLSVSLSHEGDYATAVVVALRNARRPRVDDRGEGS